MKRWNIFAIVWAVVLLGAWCIREDFISKQGESVAIAIRGYDPRDLLAGHYVTYQLDLGDALNCSGSANRASAACACLRIDDGVAKAEYTAACESEKIAACSLKLKGRCDEYSSQFISGIERYYIPEEYAPYLATVPDGSRILVRINSRGHASLQDLQVNGKGLAEYVAEKRARR